MPVFLCRWQNGDFSVVKAESKDEATFLLDEEGGAAPEDLIVLKDFMVHFRLSTDEKLQAGSLDSLVELEGFGEKTADNILLEAYPVFNEALQVAAREADGTPTEEGWKTIRQAVEEERTSFGRIIERPRGETDPTIN